MAGPGKQFDEAEALKRALDVFWDKGYEATSMQDLVEGMSINRASMYQTYGNKHALFLAALDRYIASSLNDLEQIADAAGSPMANLYRLFAQIVDESWEGKINGCFINNSAVELGPHDPEVAQRIRDFWHRMEDLFQRTLARAVAQKELPPGSDTHRLAALLNSALQGLVIKTKPRVARESLHSDLDMLFGLIKHAHEAGQ